jgi:hypothetical protein
VNVDDDGDEGEVEARERDVERGVGKREETEDHRRCGGGFVGVLLLLLDVEEGGGGVGCMTGWITRSRNLTNGNREATAAAVLGGELGNGKWIIAFAFGGGRIPNSLFPPSPPSLSLSPSPPPSPPAPPLPNPNPFRPAQSASSICKCSSAALKCAVEGNGAIS